MASGGPFLNMAVICEKVLAEKDGVVSVIRVIDRVTQATVGPDPPEEMPPLVLPGNLQMLIAFKPGETRGRHAIKIVAEEPSGIRTPINEIPVNLEAGSRGANIIMPMQAVLRHEGLYWFDVLFVGKKDQKEVLMTRIPLTVQYQPQRTALPPSDPQQG